MYDAEEAEEAVVEERDLDNDVGMADADYTASSSFAIGAPSNGRGATEAGRDQGGLEPTTSRTSRFHIVARVTIADRSCWLPLSELILLLIFSL